MGWRISALLTTALLLLGACKKDINNKEAVRAAIVDYLNKRSSTSGLDMGKMAVEVSTVSFQEDSANATVSFRLKDGGQGMEMNYALVRKGNAWEVKPKSEGSANPHGDAIPAPGGGGAGGGAMPPGHPPAGSGAPK